jgi:hypothetical protein
MLFANFFHFAGIIKLVRHQEEGWIGTCRQVEPLKKIVARWRDVFNYSFNRVSPGLFDNNKTQTQKEFNNTIYGLNFSLQLLQSSFVEIRELWAEDSILKFTMSVCRARFAFKRSCANSAFRGVLLQMLWLQIRFNYAFCTIREKCQRRTSFGGFIKKNFPEA